MTVDPRVMLDLLERIRLEVSVLREAGRLPEGELLANHLMMNGVKHGFVVAVEAAIDLAQHIVAAEGLRMPANFADYFVVLAEKGLIPSDLQPKLESMARFRNLLVHQYAKVDDAKVLEILRGNLGDLDAFVEEMGRIADV